MPHPSPGAEYLAMLHAGFARYRQSRFSGRDEEFEVHRAGGPTRFKKKDADNNFLIWQPGTSEEGRQVIDAIPSRSRHIHFRSMRSSQALAQSVFGAIMAGVGKDFLGEINAEDGLPAFGPSPRHVDMILEKSVSWLNEPRPTSVNCWIGGTYRVAIKCKFAEADFGKCSRPNLKPQKAGYCNGS